MNFSKNILGLKKLFFASNPLLCCVEFKEALC
jgi:hypothetical protein